MNRKISLLLLSIFLLTGVFGSQVITYAAETTSSAAEQKAAETKSKKKTVRKRQAGRDPANIITIIIPPARW